MYRDQTNDVLTSEFEGMAVITLRGEWDVASRDQLRRALQSIGLDQDVVVDLRQASFFDSTALGELIALFKRLDGAGHRVEALVGDSNMRRLLELTSLDRLFGVSDERAAYLGSGLPEPAWPVA